MISDSCLDMILLNMKGCFLIVFNFHISFPIKYLKILRLQEDDEGIDLSNNSNNSQENEKNINQSLSKGPFVYELYSIMIHSGSASGGHYYAYIKDFSRGEWYCFNDQSVTPVSTIAYRFQHWYSVGSI